MVQIEKVKSTLSDEFPIILGGDFNVPQGDKVFSSLDGVLIDSFAECGRGWCNTMLNVLRIDQIWVSPELTCVDAYSRYCIDTDHELYNLLLRSPDRPGLR